MKAYAGARIILAAVLLSVAGAVAAAAPAERSITLHGDGEKVVIGKLAMAPGEGGYRFEVKLDEAVMGSYFLSMRPFRCVAGERQMLCHLPHETGRSITRSDLGDLELELLFIWKRPGDGSVNAWNGVYYEMRWDGDRIEGTLRETDLNVLAVPQPGVSRPIRREDLHPGGASHRFPRITID